MKRYVLVGLFVLGFGGPVMAQSSTALLGGVVPEVAGTLLGALGELLALGEGLPIVNVLLNDGAGLELPGGVGGIVGNLIGGDLLSGGIPILTPIIAGLLGSDGGLPLIGGLLGGDLLGGGIPVIGGLLGGDGGLLLIGDLLGGDLLGGLFGGLLGGAAVSGGGQGLALDQIPLPLAELDPATAIALVNGVTLPGL